MSHRYTPTPLTPQELADARREARRRVKRATGHPEYRDWRTVLRPDGLYHCTTCSGGSARYGEPCSRCTEREIGYRKGGGDDLLARMRARNAEKKGEAA